MGRISICFRFLRNWETKRNMKASDNFANWVKLGVLKNGCFMGKHHLVFGAGCHMVFIDLATKEETYYTLNSHHQNGEGVDTLTAHTASNIFAYSEKCVIPYIYIRNFPTFNLISTLKGESYEGYLDLEFTEEPFTLLSLSKMPSFQVSVWNWKTGEKLVSISSEMFLAEQKLLCTPGRPSLCAQLGINSQFLTIYDCFSCSKEFILKKKKVKLTLKENSYLTSMAWSNDFNLLVADQQGSVYIVSPELTFNKVIDGNSALISNPLLCLHKSSIIFYNERQEILELKKSNSWKPEILLKTDLEVIQFLTNRSDTLLVISKDQRISTINLSKPGIEDFIVKQRLFTYVGLINPLGDYCFAVSENNQIITYEMSSGKIAGEYRLGKDHGVAQSNPELPYILIGNEDGTLTFINAYKPNKLLLMASLHLSKHSIDALKFGEQGQVIVAGNTTLGELFIVKCSIGNHFNVVTFIQINAQIADFMIIASKNCYRLFVIPVTSYKWIAGDKITRYCIFDDKKNVKTYEATSSKLLYYKIVGTAAENRDKIFYLLPINGKYICEMEIRKHDSTAYLLRKIWTGHQLNGCKMNLSRFQVTTWGFDGMVIVRSADFKRNVAVALPHHRFSFGIKYAVVDPLERYILSLGRDDLLVCTLISKNFNEDRAQILNNFMNYPRLVIMFQKKPVWDVSEDECKRLCYAEEVICKKIREEAEICKTERDSILREFKALQREVKHLFEINQKGPELEKLDILNFHLDSKTYKEKVNMNKKECWILEKGLKRMIAQNDAMSNFLIESYWKINEVQSRALDAIFANNRVTSYALLPFTTERKNQLEFVSKVRQMESECASKKFYPWVADSGEKLKLSIIKAQTTRLISRIDLNTDEVENDYRETTSDLYIETLSNHFNQKEIESVRQLYQEQILVEREIRMLKLEFNKKFNELFAQKEREIYDIKEKNERLRYIISEINHFAKMNIHIDIEDPGYSQMERPQEILKLHEGEIKVVPYVSPSQQVILDAQKLEEERMKLRMMADDFKERALKKMMNGVLEVKWEDLLRADVPVPKFMIEKDPEKYTQDENKAVEEYMAKVAKLKSERERYVGLLEIEFSKIRAQQEKTIKKFNDKLVGLLEYKLKIETAMIQEQFKINIIKKSFIQRNKLADQYADISNIIQNNDKHMEASTAILQTLEECLKNCKTRWETLVLKDKALVKSFKKELFDLSPGLHDAAIKLYHKRPKISLKQFTSYAVLSEIVRYITTGEEPLLVETGVMDYLEELKKLDQPVGLPNNFDETLFHLVAKYRKLKIENEIRVSAVSVEINDIEQSISIIQKRQNQCKVIQQIHEMQLEKIKKDNFSLTMDRTIILVLKRGQVEIPLSGSMRDYEGAALITTKEFDKVNEMIIASGNEKLKSIAKNMRFRRKIRMTEFEHTKSKWHINDLIEQKNDLEEVQLTKEMQIYMKAKKAGFSHEATFEVEIDRLTRSFRKDIEDLKHKVSRLKKQYKIILEQNKDIDKRIHTNYQEIRLMEDLLVGRKSVFQYHQVLAKRPEGFLRRKRYINEIEKQQKTILMLQTQLELLRLRTYPSFNYKFT